MSTEYPECPVEVPEIVDALKWAEEHPAVTPEEASANALDLLIALRRMVGGAATQTSFVRTLVKSAAQDPAARHTLATLAREELADDLKAPREVVTRVEHDLSSVSLENVYGTYKAPAGVSWLSVVIGALLGAIAGIIAMLVLDATPVAVNVDNQTASVGIGSAVDQLWFITVVVLLTTIIGGAIGSLKQTWRSVTYVAEVRAVPKKSVSTKKG